jgi:hypothetical protein
MDDYTTFILLWRDLLGGFFWAGGSLDAAHAASGLSLEGKHDEKLEWN